ncbi:NIM1-INTERACTING 2 [Olea europaea subsp. europaea]|uniref:NIM1-INTERACTING 2 n=2 Tax=Olea europaea subsp. europaea TaxID=158383 RepID=A0A8S0R651_OLEEU|nr:NIM1-INTERACTING 2 [Olea europaea subsp. europaea]
MEMEKRKWVVDGGHADGKRGKVVEDEGGEKLVPEDDEVEEFFAILRRIKEAIKYFEKRNGEIDRGLKPAAWIPSFKREDFEELNGIKKGKRSVEENHNQNVDLDLNSDPAAEQNVSDSSSSG